MTWCTVQTFLTLFFGASVCCMQISLSRHRVIRSSNSSEDIHHELNPTDATSTEVPSCMNMSDSHSEQNDRSKRSIETTTELGEGVDDFEYEEGFIECLKSVVDYGCYEIFANKSVYVPIYENKQFKRTQYYINPVNKDLYICPEFFDSDSSHQNVPFCMDTSDSLSGYDNRSKRSIETSTESGKIAEEIEYDEEFIECLKTIVEFGCYKIFSNKSVLVPIYDNKQFRPTQYVIDSKTKDLYICPDFFDEYLDNSKFSPTLGIVSLVGTSISFFCILLHIAMFMAFRKLRNLPGYCLFSLCVALVIAYLCTFIPYSRKEPSDCTATGVIKAFAFLASFFWMNVMSYDIWRSLRMATAKLRLTRDKPMMTRFVMYSTYAWGVPLFIIIVGIIVNNSPGSDEKYRLKIKEDSCWFYYRQALLVYFAVPLFTLLFLNILLFISSFIMINSATMKKAENNADLWSRFLVSFRLAVVMGLMWIFGVVAAASELMWLWYFYVICNVLQGVFIFFSFTFTEKTRKECKKALAKKKSSAMPTQVSMQQSTSV